MTYNYVLRGVLVFGFVIWSSAAAAIPSPELIIGSAASVSQLFGMGAAVLGGGAFLARRKLTTKTSKRFKQVILGLFLTCLALLAANIYQFQIKSANELAHLQSTLTRPAVIHDPTLKELSFSEQSKNALAISTDEVETLMSSSRPVTLIDVRETAENSMGTIPGAKHIRFPDVDPHADAFHQGPVILLCHNGNRSSETCAKLAALGIDCRFIEGGIEKWIVEERPFSNPTVRTLGDLRAIPDYSNKSVLFTTQDIRHLVETDDPVFVDVRYTGDFGTGHLPQAINIPLRATNTAQLKEMIADLPKRPIVAACYDRRGCFMSQVLGFELTQKGFDFRGRYTVPWEYFEPPKPKPHVVEFIAFQNRNLWQKTIDYVANALTSLGQYIGFLAAVTGLAVLTRILILPVALKSERDQIVIKANKTELEDIKQIYKDDPSQKAIELRAFYAAHGVTPLRNSLALLFLPITMIGISAVQKASAGQTGAAWLANLGAPDPLFILPLCAAILSVGYLLLCFSGSPRRNWAIAVLGFASIFAMTFTLSAGAAFYLNVALVLLIIQRLWGQGTFSHWLRSTQKSYYKNQLAVPLAATSCHQNHGNKALRLSQMAAEGLPVPDGFVIPHATLEALKTDAKTMPRLQAIAVSTFRDHLVAVRSSAAGEDGEHQSFAGVFESCIDVHPTQIAPAILQVAQSFQSQHATDYADGGCGNILVQKMVRADYAGVLFTKNPAQPAQQLLEWVAGTADDLVSGKVNPTTVVFGRLTGRKIDGDTPVDFDPLLALAAQIERLFGAPQDIEWAYANGQFQIVQSRDITTDEPRTPVMKAWSDVVTRGMDVPAVEVFLEIDEMCETLPRPTPLSLSYMRRLWGWGGSVHRACDEMGLTYGVSKHAPSHLTPVFGRLYVDKQRQAQSHVTVTRALQKRLRNDPYALERKYRNEILPQLEDQISLYAATSFSGLAPEVLRKHIVEMFDNYIQEVHVPVEQVNIVTSYFGQSARVMVEQHGENLTQIMSAQSEITPNGVLRFVGDMPDIDRHNVLRQHFGHRAPYDYELSEPRYRDTKEMMEVLIAASRVPDATPKKAARHLPQDLEEAVAFAQGYQSLKDVAKHHSLGILAQIKRAVDVLDDQLGFDGLIHYLTLDELAQPVANIETQRLQLEGRRSDRHAVLDQQAIPVQLTPWTLEQASHSTKFTGLNAMTTGTVVSGSKAVVGKIVKVSAQDTDLGRPIDGFETGDILVCPYVHPSWLPYVIRAGAVVTEVGGWLSHMAIIAREHDVLMVVGSGSTATYQTGDLLCVHPDGRVELAQEEETKIVAAG